MWIKICGTTNLADAHLAADLGADALGFIFAPSKRQIDAAAAAAITGQLPRNIDRVGVFTEVGRTEIIPTVQAARLTAVQLHMRHDPTLTRCLSSVLGPRIRLLQVIPFYTGAVDERVIRESFEDPLTVALSDPAVWAVLLDTAKAGKSGGLGESFSWRLALPAVRAAQARASAVQRGISAAELPRLLLAGGLEAANVEAAIGVLEPWGVDVVSGVEAAPGRKDPERLAAFISAARGTART